MNVVEVAGRVPRTVPRTLNWRVKRRLPLYAMLLPAVVGLLLFRYYPMYGVVIAFKDFQPLRGFAGSPWVGLKNFQQIFNMPDSWEILRNTLVIAVGKIGLGQAFSVAFALLLNEVRLRWYKRTVQSVTYMLHFLSWMIFGGILLDMLASRGIVNTALVSVGLQPVRFLTDATIFPFTVIATDVWKGFGFGAVIYLAALTGIDPALQEAAAVDGASRWQRMRHVTLPGMSSTIVLMAALSLGWVMDAGLEQLLVLCNPAVYSTGDIIDTWVYRTGLLGLQFSLGTAVGLFKGIVSLILISLSYWLAARLANYRIF